MTDTPTAQSPTGEPDDLDGTDDTGQSPDAVSGDTGPDDVAPEGESPNSEAARYRVKLREAEAERDWLAERLAAYQRKEVEAAVAGVLELPGDLFDVGQVDVASLYDENGNLDENAALGAAAALADQRPRLAKPKPPTRWGQHSHELPGEAGWGAVIRG